MKSVRHTLRIFGLNAASVKNILRNEMPEFDKVDIRVIPGDGDVVLQIAACENTFPSVVKAVVECFPKRVYGMDVPNLQTALVRALMDRKLRIATAESFTGGMISSSITDVPGASEVFECGICSYSERIKHEVLGVSESALVQSGVVSPETAREMAERVREFAGASIGIGTTGIAGPGGGSALLPAGTGYIGIAGPTETKVYLLRLSPPATDQRHWIRKTVTKYALFHALATATEWRFLDAQLR